MINDYSKNHELKTNLRILNLAGLELGQVLLAHVLKLLVLVLQAVSLRYQVAHVQDRQMVTPFLDLLVSL